mmetsp:Transcript_50290/g.161586  ORF Transcript_50290/g.161586 Transcript_50290/m.161586 type:complete len:103 (+) Transcript_50290:118-426(+)
MGGPGPGPGVLKNHLLNPWFKTAYGCSRCRFVPRFMKAFVKAALYTPLVASSPTKQFSWPMPRGTLPSRSQSRCPAYRFRRFGSCREVVVVGLPAVLFWLRQ